MELRSLGNLYRHITFFNNTEINIGLSHEKYSNDVAKGQSPTLISRRFNGKLDDQGHTGVGSMGEGRSAKIKGSGSQEGLENATTIQTEQIPTRGATGNLRPEQLGSGDS